MKEITIYCYSKCGTCRKALKWLEDNRVDYHLISIVESPPDKQQLLDIMARCGESPRKFFNTSGKKYREMGLKDRVSSMEGEEAAELLASDGMLIKRPLVLAGESVLLGFKETLWEQLLAKGS